MKKFILFSIIVLIPSLAMSQDLKSLDNKYGFRNIKFETSLSSFKDYTVTEKGKHRLFVTINRDSLNLGDVTLTSVLYVFSDSLLSHIIIKTDGLTNSRGLLQILERAYGKGYQSNKYIQAFLWAGELVDLYYDENSASNNATVMIQSRKLQAKAEEAASLKAEKAAKDAF